MQWSLHNPEDGVYNWEGIADLVAVIKAAVEADLYVILRPGPYICAEVDNGGIPYWLLTKYPNIKVRTQDIYWINEVKKWYGQLMPQLEEYMYGNGGPIILVQVENEYGAFKKCDPIYKSWLAQETQRYTQDHAVLFTVDRPFDGELECGLIDGVFATTDFGLQTEAEVDAYWEELRKVQPKGPLVNSEFYTGWLTHWQEENQRRPAGPLANTLRKMLKDGASVNFYMYFGGTNFGFWAGANDWGIGKYMADITSYDYDAPLDEAGNPTEKWEIFKNVIEEAFPEARFPEAPEKVGTVALEGFALQPKVNLLSADVRKTLGSEPKVFGLPPTFEELSQNSGLVLYETTIPEFTRDPSKLTIPDLRDRAYVYIDGYFIGILSRENDIHSLPISAGLGNKLQILVENQGRINFQVADDFKGIFGDAIFQTYNEPELKLQSWTVTGFPMEDYEAIDTLAFEKEAFVEINARGVLLDGPAIFSAEFDVPEDQLLDTYIDLEGWGKGVIFVNGVNLGRYWPLAGPQITNYIPKELLKATGNKLVLIEYQKANSDGYKVSFRNKPRLDAE